MRKKRIHVDPVTVGMLAILLLALALRFVLMSLHWPVVNADESIMDLMARHIIYQGEHPIFFWGQHYMGTIQAYLGAVLIHFFGSTVFSVRLGTLLIFALYLVCMFFLVRALYTPAYALFSIALLSIGSDRMMSIPLVANGGYAETMLFGAAIFLFATWLAMTAPRQRACVTRSRLLLYATLGVVVGLALWSDQLILSALLAGGIYLWLCCRREVWGRATLAFLAGLLLGAIPLIIYNISAAPGQNSLFVLLGTVFSGAPRVLPFSEQIAHVLLISLPLATGMPFSSGIHAICGTVEPYTQSASSLAALFPGSNPLLCIGTRGGWSVGILVLWGIAVAGVVLALRYLHRAGQEPGSDGDSQSVWQERARLYGRLMLLGSSVLWFLLFAVSAAAEYTPRASCRYLICVLLATPAVLWPLWQCLVGRHERSLLWGHRFARSRLVLSALAVLVIVGVYLTGTGDIIANIPAARSAYSQTDVLIQALLEHGATHVYSDYNTCSVLMFQSNEQVICGVLDSQLRPGVNRYTSYLVQLQSWPHPAYLFPVASPSDQVLARGIGQSGQYQHIVVGGYSIYYFKAG